MNKNQNVSSYELADVDAYRYRISVATVMDTFAEDKRKQIQEELPKEGAIDASEKLMARVEVLDVGSSDDPVTLVAYQSRYQEVNSGRKSGALKASLAGVKDDWEIPFLFYGKASDEPEQIDESEQAKKKKEPAKLMRTGVFPWIRWKERTVQWDSVKGFAFYIAIRQDSDSVITALKLEPRNGDKSSLSELEEVARKLRESVESNEWHVNDRFYLNLAGLLMYEQNVVLEGVPGTGKSYAIEKLRDLWVIASQQATGERRELADDPRVVVLHPSSSYEDLIEGIRLRVPDDDNADGSASGGATPGNRSSEAADGNSGG